MDQGLNPSGGRGLSLHICLNQPCTLPSHLYNKYWGSLPGILCVRHGTDQASPKLHNKPKAEVHVGHKLMGPKEEEASPI